MPIPIYEPPVKIQAGGKPIDLYGSPTPSPVDWFGRGVFDLMGGNFVDSVTLFRNIGTRTEPELAPAVSWWKPAGTTTAPWICA